MLGLAVFLGPFLLPYLPKPFVLPAHWQGRLQVPFRRCRGEVGVEETLTSLLCMCSYTCLSSPSLLTACLSLSLAFPGSTFWGPRHPHLGNFSRSPDLRQPMAAEPPRSVKP